MTLRLSFVFICLMCCPFIKVTAQLLENIIAVAGAEAGFPVCKAGYPASIYYEADDYELIEIVAKDLQQDILSVTGHKPELFKDAQPQGNVIIIGTVEKNSLIKKLTESGKTDLEKLDGKRESYIIQTVESPTENIDQALVISGSDRRGTAFGVYELAKQMGVSPWYWWADVPVQKKEEVMVKGGKYYAGPPSVKYRGVFLNDEAWGLKPWAARTMDTAYNTVGPNAYAKIFELLLRLKANYIWPIKHSAFNDIPENAVVADKYGIVRGSAHNAPMLVNNRREWDEKVMGEWDYAKNRDNIYKLWEEKVKEFGKYENAYTMGMRGIGDLAMKSEGSTADKVALMEQIINDQRQILAKHVNENVQEVPQVFTAYKEVLDLYKHGLNLPEDITIVWPDDNYGYIKRLPNHEEQQRKGGSGVYYHLSYLGRPHDYLWLCTTSPWLIYEEMKKAWDFNARELWVFNVGDIKPAEYELSFSMDMAYDINSISYETIENHLENWYVEKFGESPGKKAAMLKKEYYRLAFTRKPEFMGWNRLEPQTPVKDTEFSFINYSEAEKRLTANQNLKSKADNLYDEIPETEKPAFHQLVYYPVAGAALMNQKHLLAQKNRWYARQGRILANELARKVHDAHDSILLISQQYESWKNNKWEIMATYDWMPFQVYKMPPVDSVIPAKHLSWGVWTEGTPENFKGELTLPTFNNIYPQKYFFEIYNRGEKEIDFQIFHEVPWIKLSDKKGQLKKQQRIFVETVQEKLPDTGWYKTKLMVTADDKEIPVWIELFVSNKEKSEIKDVFVENNQTIVIHAANFHEKQEKPGYQWGIYENMGVSGSLVSTRPLTSKPIDYEWDVAENAACLSYHFYTFSRGWFDILSWVLPTHPVTNYRPALYGISVDEQPPLIIDFSTAYRSEEWKQNVLRNTTVHTTKHYIDTPGKHVLKVWQLTPGTYFDKFILDFGGLKESYNGPGM